MEIELYAYTLTKNTHANTVFKNCSQTKNLHKLYFAVGLKS